MKIKGSVIDIGGLFWPVRGRTKTWEVPDYKILDVKPHRKGVTADFVFDINKHFGLTQQFDNAFCIEVLDHVWNPVVAFENMNRLLREGGLLYISANFLFPHHTGFDCTRYTKSGLAKLLHETGFGVEYVKPRKAVDGDLEKALRKESKVVYHPGEIGYFVKAKKK